MTDDLYSNPLYLENQDLHFENKRLRKILEDLNGDAEKLLESILYPESVTIIETGGCPHLVICVKPRDSTNEYKILCTDVKFQFRKAMSEFDPHETKNQI